MHRTRSTVVAALAAFLALYPACPGRAAEPDKPAADPAKPKPQTAQVVLGEGGGGGVVVTNGGGGGLAPGAWGRFAVNGATVKNIWSIMSAISELNLTPDFTLTPEQKEKIQAVRDDMTQKQEKWRADHAEDFKHLQELGAGLMVRNGNVGGQLDQEKFKEYQAAQAAVQATAPKEDEAVDQIRGLLSTDQLKRLEARETRQRAESERMMKELRVRTGEVAERAKAAVEANPAPARK